MSKIKQVKIPMVLHTNGELHMEADQLAVLDLLLQEKLNWKLVRERDGLTRQSKEVKWLEWNDEGRFKSEHEEPAVGRSLIMSPFNQFFTWQTTSITEIIDSSEDGSYLKFKTGNSIYELWQKD